MKVGFFDTCLLWIPHFETDLELMDKHLKQGDEVIWFNCNGELPFCQPNPNHRKSICGNCIKRRNKGLKLLEGYPEMRDWNQAGADRIKVPDARNLNALMEVTIKDFDIGMATVSSLVSVIRDPSPDMKKYSSLWANAYRAAHDTFNQFDRILQTGEFDLIYLFNGRYAVERAVLRACEKNSVDCYVHDRGATTGQYMIYKNSLPHNRLTFIKNMEESWISPGVPQEEKIRMANLFYQERARGEEQFWISHIKDQKIGVLPEGWDENRTNIAMFTSSEDELISISSEWKNPFYTDQLEGIKRIIKDSPEEYMFYVRIHPNLMGVRNETMDMLNRLSDKNLTIISPTSKISTYSLLQAASKVISFGSTVGIEASYWGTPSILAGVSYYHGTGATYDPGSHEEVIDLLKKELPAKGKEASLKYGYFLKTFGDTYKNYQAESLYLGKYKGHYIFSANFLMMATLLFHRLRLFGWMKRKVKRYKPHFRLN